MSKYVTWDFKPENACGTSYFCLFTLIKVPIIHTLFQSQRCNVLFKHPIRSINSYTKHQRWLCLTKMNNRTTTIKLPYLSQHLLHFQIRVWLMINCTNFIHINITKCLQFLSIFHTQTPKKSIYLI